MNINKLCRLQNEVDAIWGIIISSGIQKQDYGNKTRTDDPGINAQELIAKVDGTITTIQGLKTEVKHLIVSSRNGLKHEKSWQREAIRNITKVCDDFQTGMTNENDDLKQSIRDMQENNKQELNNVKTENRELRNIIVGMRKDYQNMKQTLREVQNDNLKMKTELSKLQATTTTTPLQTTTTTIKPIPILCDGDWERFDDHCYLVVRQHKSWNDASAYCSSKNSYLIEITTDKEREFVSELVRDSGYHFYIGATDRDTTGRFIYHHSKLPIPENYWRQGEPNNYGGNQYCVYVYSYTRSGIAELFDDSCSSRYRFVCEKSAA